MMQTPKIDLTSGVLLLLLATLWGGSFFLAEIALREVPPLTITLHRVLWAVPVLFFLLRWRGVAVPVSLRLWGGYLVMGALNNAIPFSLIFWGQTELTSGLAAILNATTAVFGAVVAGLLLVDEPLTARRIGGAVLGLAGVAVIMGSEALSSFSLRNLAQVAILGAALSYAFASVWAKRVLADQPPLVNAFGMLAGSTVLMIPLAVAVDGPPRLALAIEIWGALLTLAVVSTGFAYMLYFRILARAGSANLMLVTLLIPPVAVLVGRAFLNERLEAAAWIGFGLIACGLAVTDGRLLGWLRRR